MINNFVKKILSTSVILLTSSSVIASPLGTLYIKVGGGVNIMSKHQGRAQTYKSNLAGLAEIGVGYNLLDTVRADLTFTHYFGGYYYYFCCVRLLRRHLAPPLPPLFQ